MQYKRKRILKFGIILKLAIIYIKFDIINIKFLVIKL